MLHSLRPTGRDACAAYTYLLLWFQLRAASVSESKQRCTASSPLFQARNRRPFPTSPSLTPRLFYAHTTSITTITTTTTSTTIIIVIITTTIVTTPPPLPGPPGPFQVACVAQRRSGGAGA